MLTDGEAREDIAKRFSVCTRTIDREAAWLRAHSITIRTVPMIAGGCITSMRVGEAVDMGGDELRELREEAERMAASFDTEEFRAEMARIEAEAERVIKEFEAFQIDLRGCTETDERDVRGIGISPGPYVSLWASTGEDGPIMGFRDFSAWFEG